MAYYVPRKLVLRGTLDSGTTVSVEEDHAVLVGQVGRLTVERLFRVGAQRLDGFLRACRQLRLIHRRLHRPALAPNRHLPPVDLNQLAIILLHLLRQVFLVLRHRLQNRYALFVGLDHDLLRTFITTKIPSFSML